MFHFEVFCHCLPKLWLLAILCLALTALHSHAQCGQPDGRVGDAVLPSTAVEEYEEGSQVTYVCSTGYKKSSGSSTITCTNKEWTTLTLKCEKKSCDPPEDVPHGRWNIPDGIKFGATITFHCEEGYIFPGKISYQNCLADGWSGGVFSCEAVKCDLPADIENGRYTPNSDKDYFEYQETITYTCNKDYNLIGDSVIRCSKNGTFIPSPPSCKKVNCPLQEISNGRRIGGGPPPYSLRSFIEFECHNGYTMVGPAKIICEVNGWSSTSPVCKKIDPPAPSPTTATTSPSITKTTTTSTTTTTAVRGGASCTGSLCIGVFKAFVERVLVALLIPLSLHLSL
ncbi:hypothetical protein AGOR_G00136160 [Albula goreensis]|uniref:Sushi domain-containing protein n=1 Tax=Albula goreensis TaxID=1534307 RepID=A0A8T3D7I6_9TELE|nr:hypothetical protein AGOR_G00136160 [Albula goreensis]